jgi:hypothetical protein
LQSDSNGLMKKAVSLLTPLFLFEKKLQAFLEGRFWKVKLIAFSLLVSAGILILFNFILVDVGLRTLYKEMLLPGSQDMLYWDNIISQGENPFTPHNYVLGSHEANRTFRLTIPLVAKVLHLNIAGLYVLHVLAGLVLLWLVTSIAYDILGDKSLTFYFVIGFEGIYAGANFYVNYLGHVDVFPFLFMALVAYFRNPVLVILFSQLAFWCDERAIINSSYLMLWYLLPMTDRLATEKKWDWKLIPVAAYGLVGSVLLYSLARKWLETTYGLSVGHDLSLSIKTSLWSISFVGDKAMSALEGMWLLFIAAFLVLIQSGQWLKFVLFGGAMLVTLLTMVMVADGTRAASYAFVGFFIALKILHEHVRVKEVHYLLVVSALFSNMVPLSFP